LLGGTWNTANDCIAPRRVAASIFSRHRTPRLAGTAGLCANGFTPKESIMNYDASRLLSMSQTQLDDLFRASPPGDIPNGSATGTAIIAPGTVYSSNIAEMINLFGWQGKVFDAQKGFLKNKILVSGIEAIIAKVYKAASWLDGQECIVLDYSDTSVVAHWIRDEIRLIGPNFYLGKVYWDRARLIDFCLQF
jgi:hypothetical protein